MSTKLDGGTVSPAYGRDYKTAGDAKLAFLKDAVDFKHEPSGSYCSVRDFASGSGVEIYYAKKTKSTYVIVP